MTVHCRTCGREFPRDPAKEVPCPQCGADVGSSCRRPSEHRCSIHHARDRLALALTDYGPCPEGEGETPAQAARALLDADLSVASALAALDETRADLEQVATGEHPVGDSRADTAADETASGDQTLLDHFTTE